MKKKVLQIIFPDFEEIEALTPVDVLRRAGLVVDLAALGNSREVVGRSKIKVFADTLLADIDLSEYCAVVISGGSGVYNVLDNPLLLGAVRLANSMNILVCAICAGPLILKQAGILDGKKCTGYPNTAEKLGKLYSAESPCVFDQNILTSKGMGTATDFALKIVELLLGPEKSSQIAESICYKTKQ